MNAGLWDEIEVLPFSGTINKVESTTVSNAQEPYAHNIDKGVTKYVMDNCCNSCCPVASWSAHPYWGFIHPHLACNCRHCGGSESDSGK